MEYLTVKKSEYGEKKQFTDTEIFEWMLITEVPMNFKKKQNRKNKGN